MPDIALTLEDYIIEKRDNWRDNYESNYADDHEEYYRLWRAQWAAEDKQRQSERSKLIAPALQQAVESNVAEVEEATFGRGKWFDMKDELGDPDASDVALTRERLQEDFAKEKVRKDIAECLINAAVFGTGIGEIVLETKTEYVPTQRPVAEEGMVMYGTEKRERTVVRLKPVMPQNFLIEPVATSIDDSVGVIIDEFVPRHQVEVLQEQGVYDDSVYIGDASPDLDIEPDKDLAVFHDDKIRLTKYYGLVPTDLLKEYDSEVENDTRYTEAIVIIANDGYILKAIENPYMCQDRPVVAFPWDIVPDRFWGRGVCEKGYMSQKALDTEMRARIDALALTVHPMMAMDASRMPPGAKLQVKPGHTILTNGPPSETLQPFKFGNLDPNTFNQAAALQEMVQQATGAIDSTGLLSSISGDAKAGAVSMSLGAVIKRHKRTLINFQESFLLPFVEKAAWRYMQFDPERYPSKDYKFIPSSTLGIIAREYEVGQLIQLLQTMSPDSPLYNALVESIVDNMNLSNREALIAALKQANQPTEAQQRMQQLQEQAQMLEMERANAEKNYIQSQTLEAQTRAEKNRMEAKAIPIKAEADLIRSAMGDLQDEAESKDFDRRLAILDRRLKEKDLNIKDKAVELQAIQGGRNANPTGNETPNGSNQRGV